MKEQSIESKMSAALQNGEFVVHCFIIELDKYIFEQCCKILRYWLDHNMPVVSIAVNVSRVQLSSDQFTEPHKQELYSYGAPFIV